MRLCGLQCLLDDIATHRGKWCKDIVNAIEFRPLLIYADLHPPEGIASEGLENRCYATMSSRATALAAAD